MKMLRNLTAAATVAVALGAAAPANANVIQLGFLLDSSGSIGAGNWTTIVSGLSAAINSLIPVDSSYELSVVSFSASTQVIVDHVLIDSAATRTAVAASVAAAAFLGSTTDLAEGFDTLGNVLGASTQDVDFTYVNVATDGVPDNDAAAVAERDELISEGVDNISIEAIGLGVDVTYLQTQICYPLACDSTSPYNFPGQGFYIAVGNAVEYAAAINQKIRIVTDQVPEPMTIALFGLGLAGLGFMRRKAA